MHSGVAAFDQAVGTTFGNTIAIQMIGAVSSNTVAIQVIRTIGSDAFFDQTIRATFSDTFLDQTIGATLSHTAFNQTIRAALSDNRLSSGSGESVNCKNRESDAEKSLAFHDGVLRGCYWLVWSRCYAGDFLRELH